jgi:transposase
MHVAGDIHTPLSAEMKGRLAERYINTRLVVDAHTAGAVLLEDFSQQKVFILQGFPGTLPPAYDSISAVLRSKLPEDGCGYSFNDCGRRVHVILCTLTGDAPSAQAARSWWHTVDTLRDIGECDESNGGAQFLFASRRAMSSLHLDPADGVNSQVHGSKLWVLVLASEAKEHGIVQVEADAMRERPVGTHLFSAWLACASFCWCVLHEGDTIAHSRKWLHAVCCIGDTDSISSAKYCWLAGTPAPPSSFLRSSVSRKRKTPPATPRAVSPCLEPLSIVVTAAAVASSSHSSVVQRVAAAALIADGQTAAAAATKAGISVSIARRWCKRLKVAASPDDAPRSGRPRSTDALADAAIARASELNPFASNRAIRGQLQLSISPATVGRRLDDAGLLSYFAAMKRHYTDEQRRARLSFAHGYKAWTAEQWERVIFSDEVTIEGDGRKRRIRVRRPPNCRFDPQYTQHSQIFTPSRHLFACFCSRGPGFCEMYEGKLEGKSLRDLLARTVPETAADYYQTDPTKPGHEQWWLL